MLSWSDENHSHFVLVDDGSTYEYGKEMKLRAAFEACVAGAENHEHKVSIPHPFPTCRTCLSAAHVIVLHVPVRRSARDCPAHSAYADPGAHTADSGLDTPSPSR